MPSKLDKCIARYGAVSTSNEGGLLWVAAPDWVTPLKVPDKIVMKNYLGKPVYRIFCNKDMHEPLLNAFANLISLGIEREIKTFDGCFNVRWVRGVPGVPSFHSWGVAIDFNAKENPLGAVGVWSKEFIAAFTKAGFEYGGDFKSRKDPMHLELREIPDRGKI